MLRHLHVRNLAVLAEASVELEPGLNVVTGETGAGKSLVVDSLGLLGGARASSEMIRSEADQLTVTGVFEPPPGRWLELLAGAGIECEEEQLVIRREVTRSGRNRVFLNDQPATLRLLSEVASGLLRIHGQRDELGLLSSSQQLQCVDRQGGRAADELLSRCARAYEEHRQASERLERLSGDERVRAERIDLLRYQASEISAARLEAGEEQELRRQRDRLRHAEEITTALAGALDLLSEDDLAATVRLARAQQALAAIRTWDADAESWLAELGELRVRAQELAASLGSRLSVVEADPARLDGIEERLALLERLFRKYGATSQEALERLQGIEEELAELEVDENRLAELAAEEAARLEQYQAIARELSAARSQWAQRLERSISKELAQLALKGARFRCHLGLRAREGSPLVIGGEAVEFHARGYDVANFLFSANPGEEARPLSKVASGGELARLFLALQTALRAAGGGDAATLVFDEVDAGVGGAAATVVGQKLRCLGEGGQILAVTHLPQVASLGHHHLRVLKEVSRGRTAVAVQALGEEERVEEVARMLAGTEVTTSARRHAEELLQGAGDRAGVTEP